MNRLTQERRPMLLQQKVSIAIYSIQQSLYSITIKDGEKALHLFWRTQQYLDLWRKRCPEVGKLKLDISQEQKLNTCTTKKFLYLKRNWKISSYILLQMILNLILIFWKIWLSWRISFWKSYPAIRKYYFWYLQSILMKKT